MVRSSSFLRNFFTRLITRLRQFEQNRFFWSANTLSLSQTNLLVHHHYHSMQLEVHLEIGNEKQKLNNHVSTRDKQRPSSASIADYPIQIDVKILTVVIVTIIPSGSCGYVTNGKLLSKQSVLSSNDDGRTTIND